MRNQTIGKINFFVLLFSFLVYIFGFLFSSIFSIEINLILARASASLFLIYFIIKVKFLQEKE